MVTIAFHKDLTPEKWASQPLSWQVLSIASELGRAETSLTQGLWDPFKTSLERGFELVDLTVEAHRSHEGLLKELLRFREVLAGFYVDPAPGTRAADFKTLTQVLLTLDPEAYNLLGAASHSGQTE